MRTIVARKRKGGSTGYTAQIVRKQNGTIVHREAKTFDRKQAAQAWIKRRETELSAPGAVGRGTASAATLSDAIDRYIAESVKAIGRTKAQVLRAIKSFGIAEMKCSEIGSEDIVTLARDLLAERKP